MRSLFIILNTLYFATGLRSVAFAWITAKVLLRPSTSDELAVLPHTFVDLAALVDEFAPTRALAVDPIAQVVIAVGIDVSTVAVVNVVLELSFVDDVVDFLADALHSAICSDLTDDVFVEPALAELETLAAGLTGVTSLSRMPEMFISWSPKLAKNAGRVHCPSGERVPGIGSFRKPFREHMGTW